MQNVSIIGDLKYFGCKEVKITVVECTQIKGKESENSYQELKRSRWTGTRTHTWKQNQNISTDTGILLNQKRANVCEHTTRMASLEILKGATRGLREEWMEGNLKGDYLRLKVYNTLALSVLLYGIEIWKIKEKKDMLHHKVDEVQCYRNWFVTQYVT